MFPFTQNFLFYCLFQNFNRRNWNPFEILSKRCLRVQVHWKLSLHLFTCHILIIDSAWWNGYLFGLLLAGFVKSQLLISRLQRRIPGTFIPDSQLGQPRVTLPWTVLGGSFNTICGSFAPRAPFPDTGTLGPDVKPGSLGIESPTMSSTSMAFSTGLTPPTSCLQPCCWRIPRDLDS